MPSLAFTSLLLHNALLSASRYFSSSPSSSLDSSALDSQTVFFSIHDFLGAKVCYPEPWEKTWGVTIGVLIIIYLCLVLARLCDRYLVTSLQVLCSRLGLPEDVAGVTFLALGGSMPELAIHTFATIEGSEVGVGTVIGSSVFNLTIGIVVVCFICPPGVYLKPPPLIRDSLMYIFCLCIVLFCFKYNGRVVWWEAFLMVVFYVMFVVGLILFKKNTVHKPQHYPNTGALSVSASARQPHTSSNTPRSDVIQSTTSEDEATRAHAASQGTMDETKVEGIQHRRVGQRHEGEDAHDDEEHAPLISNSSSTTVVIHPLPASSPSSSSSPPADSTEDDADDDPDGLHVSVINKHPSLPLRIFRAINAPSDWMFSYLIPSCTAKQHRHRYPYTFSLSLVWVLLLSFILMSIVQYIGCVSGIDHAVSGLIILGIAASLPDIISMAVGAARGLGVMAVSGLVGSNVFDILMGLGVPWLLHMAIHKAPVALTSDRVYQGTLLAGCSILVFALSLVIFGLEIQKRTAILPFCMYVLYVIASVLGFVKV